MKALTKYLAGAATAVALTVTAASPAEAQRWDRRDRDGIDTGDIITGVAILGGIAAIAGAFSRDGNRYGYDNRYRYRNDYTYAVNACGQEAQRYGRGGQVSVIDVDRRGSNSYRVRGVIDAGYSDFGRNSRYNRYDRYGRNDRYDRYDQRVEFSCTARANGRITDFDIDRV